MTSLTTFLSIASMNSVATSKSSPEKNINKQLNDPALKIYCTTMIKPTKTLVFFVPNHDSHLKWCPFGVWGASGYLESPHEGGIFG